MERGENVAIQPVNKILHVISTTIPWVIIALGIFLRVQPFFFSRSLWLDEAMLALNIINRTFITLTEPLNWNQTAPILFLWLEKLATYFSPKTDQMLRLFPLIAGISALIMFWFLSRKLFTQWAAWIALLLFALNGRIIYYSNEAKQYSFDVLYTILVIFVAINYLKGKATIRSIVPLAITGLIAMWSSHTVIFILAGIGITILVDAIIRKDKKAILLISVVAAIWLISFAFVYFLNLKSGSENKALLNYWQNYFMPLPPWEHLDWFSSNAKDLINFFGYKNTFFQVSIGVSILIGCIPLAKKNWRFLSILVLPIVLVLIASALDKYPFFRRLILFIFPILTLLMVFAIEWLVNLVKKYNAWIGWAVLIFLVGISVYSPMNIAVKYIKDPINKEDNKYLLAHIQDNWHKGDIIYVYHYSKAPFMYYFHQYGIKNGDYYYGIRSKEQPKQYLKDIDNLIGRKRVWFLFTHQCTTCKVDEAAYMVRHIKSIGTVLETVRKDEADLYLVDLTQPKQE